MNNEQRERDGMDSLLKDLGQAAFDANIDEYERIESEIKKAFATLPAPSDWEDEWYGEDGFVYPEMQAFFEANAEGNGYSLNVTDIPEMLDMAVRRALASRPALTVEDVISQGIESWARPYRFDERYHLGLGDIRVTPWMLDDLADRIKAAITEGEDD